MSWARVLSCAPVGLDVVGFDTATPDVMTDFVTGGNLSNSPVGEALADEM